MWIVSGDCEHRPKYLHIYSWYYLEILEIRLDRIRRDFDVCSCWQQQQNMFSLDYTFVIFLLLRLVVSSFRDVINIFLFIEFFCVQQFDNLAYAPHLKQAKDVMLSFHAKEFNQKSLM